MLMAILTAACQQNHRLLRKSRLLQIQAYQTVTKDSHPLELCYAAIVWVESKGNSLAVNPITGAAGLIQILPEDGYNGHLGYLSEANRLLGQRVYTDQDRFCPVKTREIWEIVMAHRNPTYSVDRALQLHNPGGGQRYISYVKHIMAQIDAGKIQNPCEPSKSSTI